MRSPVRPGGLLLALVCGLVVLGVRATAAETPEEFERRITTELEARNAAAASLFEQANEARGQENHRLAASLYERVAELAPDFVHAVRRQCFEVAQLGAPDKAVALCRRALEQERSPENLSALAWVLVPDEAARASSEASRESLGLAIAAVELRPNDMFTQLTLCRAALAAGDTGWFRRGVLGLERVAPDMAETHYVRALLAGGEGRLDEARRALEEARRRGLSDVQYRGLRDGLDGAQPFTQRWLPTALVAVAVWLGGLALLLLLGWALSAITLRASPRAPAEPGAHVRGLEAWVRLLYRGVLWLCCAYYYVSIPIVIALVIAVAGVVMYAFARLGGVAGKLLALAVIVTLVTLWAIVKSIFARGHDGDPGLRLDLEAHPALGALLRGVAAALGTRPVDTIYMTPGTEIAVMERGGMFRQLAGRNERCLILGAGVLDGLRVGPFKAILAHEYGHFSNEDTAGGTFALAVRRSLLTMAYGLMSGGAAAWYNPAWLFLNGFYRIFLRISHGASRLQEVLADRWAASLYGAEAFEAGLRHVIERSVRFDAHVGATLKEVLDTKAALANLYRYEPATPPSESDLERACQEALGRPASPYDSHPSPADRFAAVRATPTRGAGPSADDTAETWSLFTDRAAVERVMTAVVRQGVQANHGVEIPAGAPEPAEAR